MIKMADNNIFFMIISILALLISFYAIAGKKNVYNWSAAVWRNRIHFESFK